MGDITDFFKRIFESEVFMPRWVCGEWSEFHGWMYIISDVTIFLAYMAIPITMFIFVRKRWDDVPFKPVFWLYILFITLCGITHLIDAVIFYVPIYRFNAVMLMLTAIISMITVGGMVYVLPKALAYKSPRELERVVDQKTSQLKMQVEELDRLSSRISRKKEQLEQFAYITSHDLRSPVSNLKSLMNLLRSAETMDEQKQVLSKIEESVNTMLVTIDDVSVVVQQNSGQLIAKEVSFERVINDVLQAHEQLLNTIDSRVDIDLQVKFLHYPPDQFRSIIQNLIDNAIKYRKTNGVFELNLKTYEENGVVMFECSDNGIGIDMEKNGNRIFKLYKTAAKDGGGKGIGLFLVQNQLESNDGFITLKSELGKGTTFYVGFSNVGSKT